jgi:hypothetical protein
MGLASGYRVVRRPAQAEQPARSGSGLWTLPAETAR